MAAQQSNLPDQAGKISEAIAVPLLNQPEESVELSREELDWINSHPRVRLGVDPSWSPVDFIESGKHQGIAADILNCSVTNWD